MHITKFTLIGGGAMLMAAFAIGLATTEARVPSAVAGSNNGAVNTFEQPTPAVMTTAVSIPVAPASSAPATTLASPTAKASALPAECSMPGMCP